MSNRSMEGYWPTDDKPDRAALRYTQQTECKRRNERNRPTVARARQFASTNDRKQAVIMISSCYSTASQMPHRYCPLATSVEYVDRRHVRACPSMSAKSCPGSPLNTRFPGPPTPYAKLHLGRFSCFCMADAAYSLYRPDMPATLPKMILPLRGIWTSF